MNVFQLRGRLIDEYSDYVRSFVPIRDERNREHVDTAPEAGLLWPPSRIQLNPTFASGGSVDDLVAEGLLHPRCAEIFRAGKSPDDPAGRPLRLHRHQVEAIRAARAGANYVLTTGTGSGKSLTYIVPVVDRVLREGPGQGIRAIVVYPMNALANSPMGELEKFLGTEAPAALRPLHRSGVAGRARGRDEASGRAVPHDTAGAHSRSSGATAMRSSRVYDRSPR